MTIFTGFKKSSALAIIEGSEHTFYLGGSRRMAEISLDLYEQGALSKKHIVYINNDTDYDFYVTHTPAVEQFLLDNCFIPTSEKAIYIMDDEATQILQRDNVQVVLRKNAELYRLVFDNIPVEFYHKNLWKSAPYAQIDRSKIQEIFNLMFAVARAALAYAALQEDQRFQRLANQGEK
ncbi:MAG: hypothetical protein E4H14_09400 [Candidatus Thorarchaeota archaeon]|nr:MAG: hypothetical protein E4H14_09400 [Candidatus Thorarchaeota archaeon]